MENKVIYSWLKMDPKRELTFENSTFSTRVTFSSAKNSFENDL